MIRPPVSFAVACFVAVLAACGSGTPPPATITPEPTWTPTPLPVAEVFPTFVPTVPEGSAAERTPISALNYDGVWREVKPGLEAMLLRARVGKRDEILVLIRVDPERHVIRVRYDPTQPKLVREWFDATQADAAINAGFFLENRTTAGLIVANGEKFGQTYKGFGGMFAMRGAVPSIQWLRTQPYQADASITQAVQSAPMLVQNGRTVPGINDNGERNRRSFVAIDNKGWVLLGISQTAAWSLTDLATFLARTPALGIDDALNLDGGASSGMWVRSNIDPALTNSFDVVPSVITIGGA